MRTKFNVAKNFKGELILPGLENRILTGGNALYLNDEQLHNPHIKMAIKSGMLVEGKAPVVVKEQIKADIVEVEAPTVKLGRPKKEEEKIVVEEIQAEEVKEITIDLEEISPPEKKTNMASWDPEKKVMVDKNKSLEMVMSQMNGIDIEVQQSSTKETINFNEQLDKAVEALKDGVKKKAPLKNASKTTKSKKSSKSLKPVGKKKEMLDALDGFDESLSNEGSLLKDEDIEFVDEQQDLERLKAHPVLKDKLT